MVHLKSFVNWLVSLLPALVPKSELDQLGLITWLAKACWVSLRSKWATWLAYFSQISLGVDPELLAGNGEASNELLLCRLCALGNKTWWIGHSPGNPWWYLANVVLVWVFDKSTLLVLPKVNENSKGNMSCTKVFFRPVTIQLIRGFSISLNKPRNC